MIYMKKHSITWTEKYRPKSIDDFIGHSTKVKQIIDWLKSWNKSKQKKALVIHGPPGVGKTSLVYAIGNSLGYEIVEFNASDTRNKESILTVVLESALSQSLWNEKRIILLDEIDGLSGSQDRGGFKSIKELVEKSMHPIIFTANELDRSQIKYLNKFSKMVELDILSISDIVKVLKRICISEKLTINNDDLLNIAQRSNGDLRAAINDLQSLVFHEGILDRDTFREQQISLEDGIKNLIDIGSVSDFARLDLDTDPDTTLLLLYENSVLNGLDISDAFEIIQNISLADLFLKDISENMNWNLLKYVYEFLIIALIKSKTYPRKKIITESEWPLLIYIGKRKNDKDLLLSQLIADKLHLSVNEVKSLMPLFSQIFNKKTKKQIAEWLNVDEKQVNL